MTVVHSGTLSQKTGLKKELTSSRFVSHLVLLVSLRVAPRVARVARVASRVARVASRVARVAPRVAGVAGVAPRVVRVASCVVF